jgi:hypothetical protein
MDLVILICYLIGLALVGAGIIAGVLHPATVLFFTAGWFAGAWFTRRKR